MRKIFFYTPLLILSIILVGATLVTVPPLIFPESTKIFDRHGTLLYEYYGEVKRTRIPLSEIPLSIQQATIATEDKNFYFHPGISITGIARAALVNMRANSLRQGGSTITQQLARSVFLTREKSYSRKIKEIILSIKLEQTHSKSAILEMYLNAVPYGGNAYGVEAAAQTFFKKHARDLTLVESVYLAALTKAPSYYSPYGPHKDELDARAQLILGLMEDQGYINHDAARVAKKEAVTFQKITTAIHAPHFVMYALQELRSTYGEAALSEQGLRVITSLDLPLQTRAEELVSQYATANEKRYNAGNAALVALDPKTGQVLAMVGSRDYFDESHDGAVNVTLRPRQPGSSFKPYVYATAFKQGMNAATMLMDVVTNFGPYGDYDYIPKNYDGRERGPVSVRQALQGSLNIPAVKTIFFAGVDNSIKTAEDMGITTLDEKSRHFGPAIVLGGAEVTLLEHTSAFGVFAQNGVHHATDPFLEIRDNRGRFLKKQKTLTAPTVLDPAIAYQITNILSDNESRKFIFHNLSRNLTLKDRPVAAKTGTTQEYRDAWTVGFTPSLVTGVWVGNNDNKPMRHGADGSVVAAPIWHDFMEAALQDTPREEFARPSDIVELAVDSTSGKLPSRYTPKTKMEIFGPSNMPNQIDDVHFPRLVDGVPRIFTVYRSENPQNPSWERAVQRWLGRGKSPLPGEEKKNTEQQAVKLVDSSNPAASQ